MVVVVIVVWVEVDGGVFVVVCGFWLEVFGIFFIVYFFGGVVILVLFVDGVIDVYYCVWGYFGLYVVDGVVVFVNFGVNLFFMIMVLVEWVLLYWFYCGEEDECLVQLVS